MENIFPYEGWRGFREGSWVNEIDLRSFIRHNFTMYDGNESFLEGPTQNTLDLWEQVMDLTRQEREVVTDKASQVDFVDPASFTETAPAFIEVLIFHMLQLLNDMIFRQIMLLEL